MKNSSVFIPGQSKHTLQQTLEHFDVNRVEVMTVAQFKDLYESGRANKLYGVRGLVPSAPFFHHHDNSEIYARIKTGEVSDQTHFICENMVENDNTTLVCNGEAMLYRDEFSTYAWAGFVCYEKGLSCRLAAIHPNMKRIKTRFDVPKSIFNLIWSKKLLDYVVEFSIYTVPVGIKNSNTLIWEIRQY